MSASTNMGLLSESQYMYRTGASSPDASSHAGSTAKVCLVAAACATLVALAASTSGTPVTALWAPVTSAPAVAQVGMARITSAPRSSLVAPNAYQQPTQVVQAPWATQGSSATLFSTASGAIQANGWAMMAGLGSIAVMMGLYSKIGTSRAVPAAPLQSVALAAMSGDKPEGFGASHTSFYTSVTAKDSYATLDEILNAKMADAGVRGIVKETLDTCVKITEALRVNLVTVADAQNSAFGDVVLGVDVLADNLMWDMAKSSQYVREASSEEEPVMVETNPSGRFTICWDPLDGSSIVDNNFAVGTIVGIWDKTTGMLGATGRDQVTSVVVLYGPRTTALVVCDDGVYEFTCGEGNQWFASRERIQIKPTSKIFSPANLRACQEDPGYAKLVNFWMESKYTLRYTGGLVPDVYQCFTKEMGVFANPTSQASPAKLRVAFEVAPFALLVEKAGGSTSDGVTGNSCLDIRITSVDQRTSACLGSVNEVNRFNTMVLKK